MPDCAYSSKHDAADNVYICFCDNIGNVLILAGQLWNAMQLKCER